MNLDPTSEQVKEIWKRLERVLEKNELPGEDGAPVKCDVEDFMLMDVIDIPEYNVFDMARFKNRHTRNYLYVYRGGSHSFPKTNEPWCRGFFAHGGLS